MLKTFFAAILIKHFLILIIFCLFHLISNGQKSKIDSLQHVLKTGKADTAKVNTLNQLSRELYFIGNNDTAISHAQNAKQLAEKLNFKKGIAFSYNNIGNVYYLQGNYSAALKNYFASLKIKEEIGDKLGVASSYNNIGNVYYGQGNYPEALKNHFASLKIKEEIKDKQGIADSYNNIGLVYYHQSNYLEALKNHFASLKIKEEIGDKERIAISYVNIGLVYFNQGNYPEALKKYFAALKIKEEIGDKLGVAASYNNIGLVYSNQGNYPASLKNYFTALKIREEIEDKQGIANSYGCIGNVYTTTGKAKEGKEWLEKALQLSKEIGNKEVISGSYVGLSKADSSLAASALPSLQRRVEFAMSALENYKMYVLYKDSLINEEAIKKSEREKNKYEFDKKEAAAEAERHRQSVVAEAERKKQQIILWSVIGGLLFVVLFAGFIFRSLRITKKQKQIIEEQRDIVDIRNNEIEEQKKIVEEKNKDITDSIKYAKRIQQAKLPDVGEMQKVLPDSFVLFKPKDIVSGDFYYFTLLPTLNSPHRGEDFMTSSPTGREGEGFFIAVADCTGHGVPGAFMSMIGSEKLDDALARSSDTSEILSYLNRGIKKSLQQTDNDDSTRDGMDIALCAIEFPSSLERGGRVKLQYAGANRPLWIIRKGSKELQEIKATKKAIGGFTENSQHFDTHEIELSQGDTFYISTDGYADTFGGKDHKKIMTKKFKEILLEIQNKTMQEQEIHLNDFVENWKGRKEQVDDILVIGVRL